MRLSYQLYTSRDAGPLNQTLAMLGQAGLDHVEGYEALLGDPALDAGLRQHGLSMPSAHISLAALEDGRALDWASRYALEAVFVPYVPPEARPTDAPGWAALARRVVASGADLRGLGVAVGWHNHDFEFAPLLDGRAPVAVMAEAAPDLVFELDLGWIARAGHAPLAWIDLLRGRIAAAHIKDLAAPGQAPDEEGWADLGQGVLDYAAIAAALRAAQVPLWVLEHDRPSDATRFATRSVAAARAL
ncbi:MAG: sugar phosphate isomerase/epimerase [Pseudomonadota bacterium]